MGVEVVFGMAGSWSGIEEEYSKISGTRGFISTCLDSHPSGHGDYTFFFFVEGSARQHTRTMALAFEVTGRR